MKLQLTAIASALTLTMAMSASASGPAPSYTDANQRGSSAISAQGVTRQEMNGYGLTSHPGTRDSFILQNNGSNNSATVTQKGTQQYSRIVQTRGSNNTADVNQGKVGGGAERNESRIMQRDGDGNEAYVKQTGILDDSDILQFGSDNFADVGQINNRGGSDSIITQRGDDNTANVAQKDTYGTWSYVYQNGTDHNADITQTGEDHSSSYVYQRGNSYGGHMATVTQTGGGDNLSMIRQNEGWGQQGVATHMQVNSTGSFASTLQW